MSQPQPDGSVDVRLDEVSLQEAYLAMASDCNREAEALAWAEAMLADLDDEPMKKVRPSQRRD